MTAAIEDASSEQGLVQLARARQVLHRALAVEAQIGQRHAAVLAEQEDRAAAVDYDALREQAQASVWATLRR